MKGKKPTNTRKNTQDGRATYYLRIAKGALGYIFLLYILGMVGLVLFDSHRNPQLYSYELETKTDYYGNSVTLPADPAHKCEVQSYIIDRLWHWIIIPLRRFAFIYAGVAIALWVSQNKKARQALEKAADTLEDDEEEPET